MAHKPKYFTPNELVLHNTPSDLWVSLFGKVLDLTPLIKGREDHPDFYALLAFGGKDISHLFDKRTKEVRIHVDPITNKVDSFMPFKKFVDSDSQATIEKRYLNSKLRDDVMAETLMRRVEMQKKRNIRMTPSSEENQESPSKQFKDTMEALSKTDDNKQSLPWWKDEKYVIGLLSRKTRKIRIINMLTLQEVTLKVPNEETIDDIQERYLKYNKHARSYTWTFLGSVLDMRETLSKNGIPDRLEQLERLSLDEDDFIPSLLLYFNDDLTEE